MHHLVYARSRARSAHPPNDRSLLSHCFPIANPLHVPHLSALSTTRLLGLAARCATS